MDEDKRRHPLADAPDFMASLSGLDRGLNQADPPNEDAPPAVPPAPPLIGTPIGTPHSAVPAQVPHTPSRPATAGRPLLDLFPPEALMHGAMIARHRNDRRPDDSQPDVNGPRFDRIHRLSGRPFDPSPDVRFLYHSRSLDSVMQEAIGALERGEAAAIVTGDRGCGKTMLCRALADRVSARTVVSLVLEPSNPIEELLRSALVDFGVISRDDLRRGPLMQASRERLSEALRDFLTSLAPLHASALLVVDDAHRAPKEVLELLQELIGGGQARPLLQAVLVGSPALAHVLDGLDVGALRSGAATSYTLQPLAADEIAGYIAHRLSVVGMSGGVEFDDEAIERIGALSSGVPRAINLLCDRTLDLATSESAVLIGRDLIDEAAAEVELERPSRSWLAAALVVLVVAASVIVGAAAAAWVFSTRLQAAVTRWEAVPPAPPRPAIRTPERAVPIAAPDSRVDPAGRTPSASRGSVSDSR